jgi:hypothetical protein
MLINSTIDMSGVSGYPNNSEGWGLIRLDEVLGFQGSGPLLSLWDRRHSQGLTTGETAVYSVEVRSASKPLKITLVWTEPPGEFGADDPVVNDLDLRVTSPDGRTTYLGNNLDNGASVPGGSADERNNVEVVLVRSPALGSWTITVHATSVNVGDPGQGYALVSTTARPEWLTPALHITMH